MLIRVFPPHYQLVYINFDISSFSLISYRMKEHNVLGRRYFYPLISTFSTYKGLQSAGPENLPNAHKMADCVICLPMHHALNQENIYRILNCIRK